MPPPDANPPAWHTLTAAEAVTRLATDATRGLGRNEAAHRLREHGPNALPEPPGRGVLALLAGQFGEFMILVLLAAAAISFALGDRTDALVILLVVLLNGLIGAFQEWRAEQALAALRALAAPAARVRRDGEVLTVPATDLVPGDLVLLEAGTLVPADIRLTESVSLAVAEAALTGESEPVAKSVAAMASADLPVADRASMAWKGTLATYGRGSGVVVATGTATELGRVATLLAQAETVKTPLQLRLAALGRRLAIAVLVICALIFAAGLARGEPALLMFMTAVSLAVAAIPEALPAVVAIALALGARRMARQHALVRHLPAVETLGSVTVICSDKTGTLTQNRMRVEAYWVHGAHHRAGELPAAAHNHATWTAMRHAMALVNDATCTAAGVEGEPTEVALMEATLAAGIDWGALRADRPRVAELPFDSDRKRMATLHGEAGRVVAFVKGAPESVLPRCRFQAATGADQAMDAQAAIAAAETMARDGMRVLAFARRHFDTLPARHADAEDDLVFLGLVGLMDPPRAEAEQAVARCREAGIVPVMITGDHPATAAAVARRLGILTPDREVMTGPQLAGTADTDLVSRAAAVAVYARVDPAQKIRIVEALQAGGQCVAMGRGGTDVARETADMVLLDDNFATIVHAVREGRRIYDNIRRFVRYALTGNAGEIWTIALAPFFGLPIPLLPIHILWINLVTDGLPGLALTIEEADRRAMRRPPRPVGESMFAGGMWQQILWVGLLIGAVSLFAQQWALTHGAHAQSMVFTVLTLSQLFLALAMRSESETLLAAGLAGNTALTATVLVTIALQLATLYVPALNGLFHTAPLGAGELALCFGLGLTPFAGMELQKVWLARRRQAAA